MYLNSTTVTYRRCIAKPYPEAREELMTLPGVGEKTADVVLLFNAGKHVLPVDRHIARIAKRLELVKDKPTYDTLRLTLEGATTPDKFLDTHIKLIQFGRDICRALNPKCQDARSTISAHTPKGPRKDLNSQNNQIRATPAKKRLEIVFYNHIRII